MTSAAETERFELIWGLFPPRDPRTKDWLFVGNPFAIFFTLFAYIYIVKIGGPRWMAKREPFQNLKPYIRFYNISMVVSNVYFMYKFLRHSYLGGNYSLFCQGMTHSRDENAMAILNLSYWYLYVRAADFFDTFFFLLRKKFSHISALHWTHHALVVWSGWLWLTLGSDGHVLLGLIVNSAMHVIMYSYYFLASFGPRFQKYLWWKKYLTTMQITQFVVLLFHILIPVFYDCGYPRGLIYIAFAQGSFGLVLFINFYVQAYINKKPGSAAKMIDNMCTLDSGSSMSVERPKRA